MSWLFSQALVAEYLRASCSETRPSVPLNLTGPPQAFSCDDRTTATFNHSRSGMTCAPLTVTLGEELLTWFLAASRARTSALPAAATAWTENAADSGERWRAWFAKWNPASCEWRTAQCSLLEDSEPFSETWPRSGLMRDGTCYQLPTAAPTIFANASGSLLPTLTVCGNYNAKGASNGLATALAKRLPTLLASDAAKGGPNAVHGSGTMSLTAAVARLPTLTARDFRSERRSAQGFSKRAAERRGHTLPATLDHEAGGQGGPLNPDWCEWFMGFPIGWTASEPLETHRFREWRLQHGKCS